MSLAAPIEYTADTVDQMRADYAARRRRFYHVPNVVPLEIVGRSVPAPEPEPVNDDAVESVDIPRFLPPRRTDWTQMVSDAVLRPCDAKIVLKHVYLRTGIKILDIQSERRTAKVVLPRMLACWVMREFTTLSLPQIGRHLGNRDHTTVLHSVRKIEALRETDPAIRQLSDEIATAACKEMHE